MPRPYTPEKKAQIAQTLIENRGSQADAARKLGMKPNALNEWLRNNHNDPAVKAAMAAIGTGLTPSVTWVKTKATDTEPAYSVMLRPAEKTPEDVADQIAKRMAQVVAIPPIPAPSFTSADRLNFIPLFDVHMGMRSGSYGTADAVNRLKIGFRDVLDRAPPSATTIILNGGDFTEANDNSALTPDSKHPLAVDMDFSDLIDIATDVTIDLIEYALTRSDKVVYQALEANHDPASTIAIRQGLRQRYRDNPRFYMPRGQEVFTYEWEGNLLAGIHGNQKNSKPEALTLAIASRHAVAWGAAKRRELWRGHKHNEITVNVPGMRVYQVNPICPPGRYANRNLFTGESDIQCVTYGKGGGRKATTVHIFDD